MVKGMLLHRIDAPTITPEDTQPLMDACIDFMNYKSEIVERAILIFMNAMEITKKELAKRGIRKVYVGSNDEEFYYHDILIIQLKIITTKTGLMLNIKAPTFVLRELTPFIRMKELDAQAKEAGWSTLLPNVQSNSPDKDIEQQEELK